MWLQESINKLPVFSPSLCIIHLSLQSNLVKFPSNNNEHGNAYHQDNVVQKNHRVKDQITVSWATKKGRNIGNSGSIIFHCKSGNHSRQWDQKTYAQRIRQFRANWDK